MTLGVAVFMAVLGGSVASNPADRELGRLIRDLESILDKQREVTDGIRQQVAVMGSCQYKRYPRLFIPDTQTIRRGELRNIPVEIDWRSFKDSTITIRVETLSDETGTWVPDRIELDEESHGDQFNLPVKAGKSPGEVLVRLTPGQGARIEFKVVVK